MSARHHSGMSLEEVARELGMTKQAVYQIEQKAMAKMRARLGSSYRGTIGPFLIDYCGTREKPTSSADDAWRRRTRGRGKHGQYVRGG